MQEHMAVEVSAVCGAAVVRAQPDAWAVVILLLHFSKQPPPSFCSTLPVLHRSSYQCRYLFCWRRVKQLIQPTLWTLAVGAGARTQKQQRAHAWVRAPFIASGELMIRVAELGNGAEQLGLVQGGSFCDNTVHMNFGCDDTVPLAARNCMALPTPSDRFFGNPLNTHS